MNQDSPVENSNMNSNSLIRKDLQHYTAASNLAFNERVKALIGSGVDVAHFGFGQSPFPVPAPFLEGLKLHAHRHEYLPSAGLPELREDILEFHREWEGLDHFHTDNVVIGPGTKELLFLTINVFAGDVLLVSPAWMTYEPQTVLAQKKSFVIHTNKSDSYKLTPGLLETFLSDQNVSSEWKLLVFNNPNNPTGLVYSDEEIKALAPVFRAHKVLVMSDEIYGRLAFDGEFRSVARHYPEGVVLYSGFSKWASAGGWRAGYALFPAELSSLCRAVQSAGSHTFTCAPTPVQHALHHALQHKDTLRQYILVYPLSHSNSVKNNRCVENSRKVLKWVGDYCHERLEKVGIRGHASQAGYYYMPDFEGIRGGLEAGGVRSGWEMCEAMLRECGVAMMPCSPTCLRPGPELTTRFCFINFDGAAAFSGLEETPGLEGSDFVEKYCQPTVAGLNRLEAWIRKHQ